MLNLIYPRWTRQSLILESSTTAGYYTLMMMHRMMHRKQVSVLGMDNRSSRDFRMERSQRPGKLSYIQDNDLDKKNHNSDMLSLL